MTNQEEAAIPTQTGLGPHGERAAGSELAQLTPEVCAQAQTRGFEVAVLLHTQASDWSQRQIAGIRTRLAEAGAHLSEIVDCDYRPDLQIAAVERLVAARPDAVIAIPVGGTAVADAFRRLSAAGIRLVQGSHIVVPALFTHDRAYIFQNGDGRIVFAIPYEGRFTLIGTTDRDYAGDPARVVADPDEIAYLCAAASRWFQAPVRADDVVWSFSGVRPLQDDGAGAAQAATRDYVLDLDAPQGEAPLLSVFGGKITTYRRLAEHALERLAPHLPGLSPRAWTADAPLPGGDFPRDGFPTLVADLRDAYPWLTVAHAERLARAYGTRAPAILGNATGLAGLGGVLGADLTRAEVDYLVRFEWARTADDVLWRRSKLGLHLRPNEVAALEEHLDGVVQAA